MIPKQILSRISAIVIFFFLFAGLPPASGSKQGAMAAGLSPQALPPTTTLASLHSNGAQGNANSVYPSISSDGRFVAFLSSADNLISDDTNEKMDIFVRDRTLQTTERVSVSSSGQQANNHSFWPMISANGRYVVFHSTATNLVDGDDNDCEDVFVRDLQTDTTVRVSVHSDGTQGNLGSTSGVISEDGRYVAFVSGAINLIGTDLDHNGSCDVDCDTNNAGDVFVHDLQAGTTWRVSVSASGAQGNNVSGGFVISISSTGRYVAFASAATNLVTGDTNGVGDIFVRDWQAGTTTLVSVASVGGGYQYGSGEPSISADGRFVAFTSSDNLVGDDTNGCADIYLRDVLTGQTTRVSVHSNGTQGNFTSQHPSISADGKYISFISGAWNLVDDDTNNYQDVFVHTRLTHKTERVSLHTNGSQSAGLTEQNAISTDGRFVTFSSYASTLVDNDTNMTEDIFVRDRGGTNVLVQDETGAPVPNAQVYLNNTQAGITTSDGTVVILGLQNGDTLAARSLITDLGTVKGNHSQDAAQNWAYRVYITSLDIPQNGEPTPLTVTDSNATQVLTLKKANSLMGFNILASVEWDATAAYLNELRQGFELASAYLYDASDGQMLFEQVAIYDNARYWIDADYQLNINNTTWPQADAGAVISSTRNAYVYLGPYWSGRTSREGNWTQPNGYRTQIHEFGHYGLWLFDSYFYYGFDGNKPEGHCTSEAIHHNTTAAVNATLMDYQYNATEFAMQGVAGLWSAECTLTAQYQHYAKSDWEIVAFYFRDWQNPARWTLKTPADYAGVVTGPTAIPVGAWTQANTYNTDAGACATPPTIVATIGGTVVPTATVELEHIGGTSRISLGVSDAAGRLTILGARAGDTVHIFRQVDKKTWTHGSAVVACPARLDASEFTGEPDLEIELSVNPFPLSVDILPGAASDQITITVQTTATLAAPPEVSIQQTGVTTTLPVAMIYDSGLAAYVGSATLLPDYQQTGTALVRATDATSQTATFLAIFSLTPVAAGEDTTIWSANGRAELYLPAGALSTDGRVSLSPAEIPGPAPEGMLLLGSPYTLRAEEGVTLTGIATISLFYDDLGDALARVRLFGAAIYRWNGAAWEALDSTFDGDQQYAAAPVNEFGVYALMTPSSPIFPVYLPVAMK